MYRQNCRLLFIHVIVEVNIGFNAEPYAIETPELIFYCSVVKNCLAGESDIY